MPIRRCLDCPAFAAGASRCPKCTALRKSLRNAETPRARELVARALAAGASCALCHKPFTADDPPTAGHADQPISRGGGGGRLQPEHRSCGSRQGARHGI